MKRPKNDDPSLWEPVQAEPTQTTTDELELVRSKQQNRNDQDRKLVTTFSSLASLRPGRRLHESLPMDPLDRLVRKAKCHPKVVSKVFKVGKFWAKFEKKEPLVGWRGPLHEALGPGDRRIL